ncbi:MAG: class I SAM-dependent methyltransferase [Rikenellaceae bacterium]
MSKIATAERVSREASDNFVFQRSILAYHYAATRVNGRILEIGTGSGYGVDVMAPLASEFVTLDKFKSDLDTSKYTNVTYIYTEVPPIQFEDEQFDCVISFQVIEHIKEDAHLISEIHRVLKKGGLFIVSTPNIGMSLTRNPWHVREYTASEFEKLLGDKFSDIETLGVVGNEKVMEYYEKNREAVKRYTRWDILDLQYRLPRWMLQIPYDILNRVNRRKLLEKNNSLTESITMEDYSVVPVCDNAFDLLYVARK